jgi:hypothetical protein
MRANWAAWWVIGWGIIILLAAIWELIASKYEMSGVFQFPSLSSIIVAVIPLPVLYVLTIGTAAFLCWHWYDMVTRWGR